jgi:hypothetical protein
MAVEISPFVSRETSGRPDDLAGNEHIRADKRRSMRAFAEYVARLRMLTKA